MSTAVGVPADSLPKDARAKKIAAADESSSKFAMSTCIGTDVDDRGLPCPLSKLCSESEKESKASKEWPVNFWSMVVKCRR